MSIEAKVGAGKVPGLACEPSYAGHQIQYADCMVRYIRQMLLTSKSTTSSWLALILFTVSYIISGLMFHTCSYVHDQRPRQEKEIDAETLLDKETQAINGTLQPGVQFCCWLNASKSWAELLDGYFRDSHYNENSRKANS